MYTENGFQTSIKHILSPCDGSLFDVLHNNMSMASLEIEKLTHLGAIYLNQRRVFHDVEIKKNDYLRIHTQPKRFIANDHLWTQRVLYQNEHFMVVNKIAGLPCHASVDNAQENLISYLQEDFHQKLFITHRLDQETHGLILIAKNKEYQKIFNELLKTHQVTKKYKTLVASHGSKAPPLGPWIHFMKPSPRSPKTISKAPNSNKDFRCELHILDRQAFLITNSESLSPLSCFQLQIHLITGRTHQIRAQLSFEGFPIVGDTLYKSPFSSFKMNLQCHHLEFIDPISKQLIKINQ